MKKHTMGKIEKDLGQNKKFPSNKGTNRNRQKKNPYDEYDVYVSLRLNNY